MMSVLVPTGVSEDERFTVTTPEGASLVVAVPKGAATGAVIAVPLPPSAPVVAQPVGAEYQAGPAAVAVGALGAAPRLPLPDEVEPYRCPGPTWSPTREHKQLHAFAIVQVVVEPVCAIASCCVLCGPSFAGCIWSMCLAAVGALAQAACGIVVGVGSWERPGARAYVAVAALVVAVRVLVVVNVSGDEPEQITGMTYDDWSYNDGWHPIYNDNDGAYGFCDYGAGIFCGDSSATASDAIATNATYASPDFVDADWAGSFVTWLACAQDHVECATDDAVCYAEARAPLLPLRGARSI